MKRMLLSLGICFCLISFNAEAKTNYVVIGAFASKAHAEQFMKANSPAMLGLNPARNLFYVYVLETQNWKKASAEALRLRSEHRYDDAWVFIGTLGDVIAIDSNEVQPVSEQPPITEVITDKPSSNEQPADSSLLTASTTIVIEQPPVTATDPAETTKNFYFKIYRSADHEQVDGEVVVVNLENQRNAGTQKGNATVTIKAPNRSGDIRLECEVMGYRKAVQLINFKNPAANDVVVVENDVINVPFELVRLQKGDIAIMYNVFFYKDASLMRPESKYDLDGLVKMMNENPNYRVRIHGHTNGKAAGKIIEPGTDRNLFSLSNSVDGRGSAKKLSQKRAAIIAEYLVSQGVDEKRLEVKAWGGKKPIYDRDHAQASANVRVEIEVLQD